jgi:hypothetical protein
MYQQKKVSINRNQFTLMSFFHIREQCDFIPNICRVLNWDPFSDVTYSRPQICWKEKCGRRSLSFHTMRENVTIKGTRVNLDVIITDQFLCWLIGSAVQYYATNFIASDCKCNLCIGFCHFLSCDESNREHVKMIWNLLHTLANMYLSHRC